MPRTLSQIRYAGKSHRVVDELRLGRHKLLVVEKLGGSARRVYRAFEPGLVGQMRCVHLLARDQVDQQQLRTLARISAPQASLPFIVDSFRHRDDVVVITKWVEGPSLEGYLSDCRSGREPWPSATIVFNLIRRLAHACCLLHERLGVIHGDIHPGNLILCRHTKQLVPIDFGSAWFVEKAKRRGPGHGGARLYSAPELLTENGSPGFRADQFAVMVVGYELLTGMIPYDRLGGLAANAPDRPQLELPSRQLKHAGRLPKELRTRIDDLFIQCLALRADDRYQTTRLWTRALDELASELRGDSRMAPANRWLLHQIDRWSRWWEAS